MKFIKANSLTVRRLFKNRKFLELIQIPIQLDFSFTIPYLAGYAKDGKRVYFDRDLKINWKYKGRIVDVCDFLLVHEITEWVLIEHFNWYYQKAHHIATHVEALACREHGINWWDYTKYLNPQIKTAYHEKITKVPKDLDLRPYEDEHEQKVLQELQQGHRKSTKESLTYESHRIINGVWRNVMDISDGLR